MLQKQTLDRNHIANGRWTMCTEPEESVHDSHYANFAHTLLWQCNDILLRSMRQLLT